MNPQQKILKPKSRPIQIEPWFFRYLNEGQLKVVSAIFAHASYKDRISDSFASNKTLAFYAGFGQLKEDELKELQKLSKEEQKKYKKKKLNNAIRSIKAVKQKLEEMGVITRVVEGTKSYAIMNLEWGKERYLKEFNEYFNDEIVEEKPAKDEIKEKLNKLTKLANNGNISEENLLKELESLTDVYSESKSIKNNISNLSEDDIEYIAQQEMDTKKVKLKIESGEIEHADKYKNGIKKLIKENKFNGIEKYIKNKIEITNDSKNNTQGNTVKDTLEEQKAYAYNFNKMKVVSDNLKDWLQFKVKLNWRGNYYLKDITSFEIKTKQGLLKLGWKEMMHPYLISKQEIILYKIDTNEDDDNTIDVEVSNSS